ncbi:MAG: flagellin modification protein FlmC [Phenylobacterium zucineum]|nr:MAG: flagellin modification protein FlmC [Phenylobacterium zucineum]
MAVAILQARMSSSRLPGKVLMPLAGRPMITRQIERLSRCQRLERVIVATSTDPSDDPLYSQLSAVGVDVFRGSLGNVLARYLACAQHFDLSGALVRLTADCPLIDPMVVDQAIDMQKTTGADYVTNGQHRTYPRGLDVEVFPLSILEDVGARARDAYDQEHVTPYIYHHPEIYTRRDLVNLAGNDSHLRWTVDTPEDYTFVAKVYDMLYPSNPDFTSEDIRALPFSHFEPELRKTL